MGDKKSKHDPDLSVVADVNEQASYPEPDGVLRRTLRGDESKGDPDERDIAGATRFEDTPRGREEAKTNKAGAAKEDGGQ